MAKLDTRTTRLGAVLQFEERPEYGYCRKVVTVNEETAKNYVVGTVLGKVTADGKYKVLEATAVDGSKDFGGIYTGSPDGHDVQAIPASTDVEVVILYRGPAGVGDGYLVFGESVDTAGEKEAVYAQMDAVGIAVLNQPNQFA